MPRYYPNTRFSDCWSSVGNVTFYHRDGVCYFRKRAICTFGGSAGQVAVSDVHHRALAAWRELSHDVQLQWNAIAASVRPHRPPFDGSAHITGHNLFVSAYHGFAQLGNEHIPVPQAYEEFPVFVCEYDSAAVENGTDLRLNLRVRFKGNVNPARYRLAVRIQLTRPGAGRQPGYLRSFIASGNCTAEDCLAEIFIPGYRDIWNLDLESYQVHLRYFLIDSKTGYRNIFKRKSFLIDIPNS